MTNDEITELTEENTIVPVYMSVATAKRFVESAEIVIGMWKPCQETDDLKWMRTSMVIALREYEKVK